MATVLVDQDGVLCPFDPELNATLSRIHPGHPMILANRDSYELFTGDMALDKSMMAAMNDAGFYQRLTVMPYAREALEEIEAEGHTVFICSSPWLGNPTCASDKLRWIEEHLGEKWAKRTILTQDKTLVRGDYLIDDKPCITGAMTPTWAHIPFHQPYNALLDGPRLTDWSNWRTELPFLVQKKALVTA